MEKFPAPVSKLPQSILIGFGDEAMKVNQTYIISFSSGIRQSGGERVSDVELRRKFRECCARQRQDRRLFNDTGSDYIFDKFMRL